MDAHYENLERRTAGELLWHYTDWAAFENIIRKGELLASDYRFMNDRTELRHALQFCKNVFKDRVEHLDRFISETLAGGEPGLPSAYVLSTCKQFDSLEQWRGYAQSSVGVALAFDEAKLTQLCNRFGYRRLECVYEEHHKTPRIEHLLKAIADETPRREELEVVTREEKDGGRMHRAGRDLAQARQRDIGNFLRDIVLAFKDPAFKLENEFRFTSPFFGGLMSPMRQTNQLPRCTPATAFRRGRAAGTIVPFAKLPLFPDQEKLKQLGMEPTQHPLVGILLGPTVQPEVLADGIVQSQLLTWIQDEGKTHADHYRQLKIALSEVPLRA